MEKWGFKKEKLARSIQIRNVDGTNNSRGMVMHKIECNLYYKRHVEQVKMDVCDLERIEVILGIPWLAVHNPEIDWEKREVKMTRCLPLYGRNQEIGKSKVKKQVKREEKPDEEIVRELVLKRFQRQKKVFGKAESEQMPVQKAWDHAIELKKGFVPRKGKVYILSREK